MHNREVNQYCTEVPFDPPEAYPELPFIEGTNENNAIYPMVRELLQQLRLDNGNIGTPKWNPFKDIVKPGNTVLIKPNLITHRHYLGEDALYSTVVHGSFIRPIIDYLYLALDGRGSIIIADNPIVGTDFKALMDFTGIQAMVDELVTAGYNNLEVIDLRPKVLREAKNGNFYYEDQQGDPLGYVDVNLGSDSFFSEFDGNPNIHYCTLADPSVDHIDPKFIGRSETDNYHNPSVHKYSVSKSILNADIIISVAKMKTHCKAGVTLTLKNMIGVVYGKGCIPHHRQGLPPNGDSFPFYPPSHYVFFKKTYVKLRKLLRVHRFPGFRPFRNYLQKNKILIGQYIEHGNWKGNDTIWRSILDLNRIVIYADKEGKMHDTPQRNYFGLIDGIIGQQGDGPMGGDPVISSIIFGGFNPVIVDALAIKALNIDFNSIKLISNAGNIERWKLLPNKNFNFSFPDIKVPNLSFKLPKGWQ